MDVTNSVNFTIQELTVNPGLDVFPWLHTVAQAFEHYRLIKCSFSYAPFVGTSHVGMVGMAPDYNMDEPVATDFKDLMSQAGATRGQVFVEQRLRVDPAIAHALNKWKYVRHQDYTVTERSIYDACTIQIATERGANGNVIGEIYVDYTFEFMTPQVQHPIQPTSGLYVAPHRSSAENYDLGDTVQLAMPPSVYNTLVPEDKVSPAGIELSPGTYRAIANLALSSEITTSDPGTATLGSFFTLDGAPLFGIDTFSNYFFQTDATATERSHTLDLDEIFFTPSSTVLGLQLVSQLVGGGVASATDWSVLKHSGLKLMRLMDERSRAPLP